MPNETMKHWAFDAAEKCAPLIEKVEDGLDEHHRPHLRAMCATIRLGNMSATKACRWLGWIQACLCVHGVSSLAELKNINKQCSEQASNNIANKSLCGLFNPSKAQL